MLNVREQVFSGINEKLEKLSGLNPDILGNTGQQQLNDFRKSFEEIAEECLTIVAVKDVDICVDGGTRSYVYGSVRDDQIFDKIPEEINKLRYNVDVLYAKFFRDNES